MLVNIKFARKMAKGSTPHFTLSQQVISDNRDKLINSVDLDGLYRYLIEHDMLTESLKKELQSDRPQREKNQLLFSTLNDQLEALPKLILCLRQSATDHARLAHHGHLAQDLHEQQINAEKKSVDTVGEQVENITVGHNEREQLLNDDQTGGHRADNDTVAHNNNHNHRRATGRHCKKVLKQVCIPASICYMLAVILCVLCSIPAAVVPWRFWAQTTTYSKTMRVSYNQTVQLPIEPHVDIYSFPLQFMMPDCVQSAGICNCICNVLVLPCSNLSSLEIFTQDVTKDSDFFLNPDGLFYLLNRSTISVTYSGSSKSGQDTASVWIFWNQKAATNSSNFYPECSDPKYTKYGICMTLKKEEMFVYNVPYDEFYFIRCYVDGTTDCFNNIHWTMDIYSYDYHRYINLTDANVPIRMYSVTTTKKTQIILRDTKIDVVPSNPDFVKCVLIHKPATFDCQQSDSSSYVYVSDVTQVYDSWLISALVLLAVMIMIISVAVFVHVKCCFSEAKKPGPV